MTRFDNFIDIVLGVLVVALFVFSIWVSVYVAQLVPLGFVAPVLLFCSGAAIGVVVTYYAIKGREKT